jgi:predicted kinase
MADFIMLVGISGSGKSEMAKILSELGGCEVVSNSELRKELNGNSAIPVSSQKLHEEAHRRIVKGLKEGKNVVYDATNLKMKQRKGLLYKLRGIDCEKNCIVSIRTIENCIEATKDVFSPDVIMEQVKAFETPYFYEGWDNIYLAYDKEKYCLSDIDNRLKGMPHDNEHHSLDILGHMQKAQEIYSQMCTGSEYKSENLAMLFAVSYHDIGKLYTKEFIPGDKNAHYFNHHNVGAYMFLASEVPETIDPLQVAVLIQWHMEHYFRKGKGMEKFKKLIGEDLSANLDLLHAIDKKAH